MPGARQVTIPINCGTAGALLWLLAVGLTAWDMFGGPDDVGRLACIVGLAAASLTFDALLRFHRRVVLEVMNYEFRMRDQGGAAEHPDGGGYLTPRQLHSVASTQRTRMS